ncbi:hypothetical protein BN1221_01655 [Brenneria goodwinii]|uniref:Uncharacterized protein n=1 Tax=Brenneria goodwinii TaxID=1109412 RepID=A0A0G4JTH4_9GAMM|nr:hypothetical protein BN1221_01655 [Brenneria goodwinii]
MQRRWPIKIEAAANTAQIRVRPAGFPMVLLTGFAGLYSMIDWRHLEIYRVIALFLRHI